MPEAVVVKTRKFKRNPLLSRRQVCISSSSRYRKWTPSLSHNAGTHGGWSIMALTEGRALRYLLFARSEWCRAQQIVERRAFNRFETYQIAVYRKEGLVDVSCRPPRLPPRIRAFTRYYCICLKNIGSSVHKEVCFTLNPSASWHNESLMVGRKHEWSKANNTSRVHPH
jgi:hypothetical protein